MKKSVMNIFFKLLSISFFLFIYFELFIFIILFNPYITSQMPPIIFKITIVLVFISTIKLDKFIPKIIKILSDKLQNITDVKTKFFFNPWSYF